MNEEKSTRYHRLKRRTELLAILTRGTLFVAFLCCGGSVVLRDAATRFAAAVQVPAIVHVSTIVAAYTFPLMVLGELLVFPFIWYRGFVLDRRYWRSLRSPVDWIKGYTKTQTTQLLLWTIAAVLIYAAIWKWPTMWWAITGVGFGFSMILVTYLAPVVVLPLLYRLRPLDRPLLQVRLENLACRLGAPVTRMQEWQLGHETSRPNAVLVGIGQTRRVLLTDALLADYSDDEIEVVVAHELAHLVHRDIWKSIAFHTASVTLACALAHWTLRWTGPSLGVNGVGDVSGLPLMLLVGGGAMMLLAPVANLMSRLHEERADRSALEATGNPDALMSGLRRTAARHLAEERPSQIVKWLFYSHPPLVDRVAAVKAAIGGRSFSRKD